MDAQSFDLADHSRHKYSNMLVLPYMDYGGHLANPAGFTVFRIQESLL